MTFETRTLQEHDAAHHLHPFTDAATLGIDDTRVIVRGEGVYVQDSEGRRYLDAMSGLWCVNIGYGRHEIAEAAFRQMRELPYYNTFFRTTHPPAVKLAKVLTEIAPAGFERCIFTSSGSEAVDSAYRIARHYWNTVGEQERKIIVSRENAYHGTTVAGAALGGMPSMHAQGGDVLSDYVIRIPSPYLYPEGHQANPDEFGLACAHALERAIDRAGPERIAAFIAEPVQGAGGLIIPPDTYWPEIQRICRERDILFIVDEVICGFGRTGRWFGTEYFDLKPDLMTVAKGLSSGYLPVGAVLVGERVGDVVATSGGEFAHGHTYSGHPACAAAALENLRIMQDENVIAHAGHTVVPAFAERWKTLADHPLVGEARSLGLLGAIELTPNKSTRAPFPGDPGKAGLVCREHCMSNGLIMRSIRDTMVVAPPLVIQESELDELVALALKSLDEIRSELISSGLL